MTEKKKPLAILVILGIAVTAVSLIALFWSVSYTNDFQNLATHGLGSLIGQSDPTFELAKMLKVISPIGALAGVIIAVAGLIIRK